MIKKGESNLNQPWHNSYPNGIHRQIDIPSISLFEILERTVEDYPTNKAIIDGDKELNYVQLKEKCERLAAALYQRGFRKGDRIALMLPNSMEYVISYYAIHRLGGVVVQVNPMYQPSELDYILQDSEAILLICRQEQKQKLEQTAMADKLTIIFADEDDRLENSLYYWIEKGNTELPALDVNPKEDIAVLQYTGGTTGRSKGVMLTHSNLFSVLYQSFVFQGGVRQPNNSNIGLPPLIHVMGMSRLNANVFNGQTFVCVARFDVNRLLELIRKHRPTMLPAVPTILIGLLNHPDLDPEDLDCIKNCVSGSAPLPVEVANEFEQRTGVKILEGYGLSETPVSHLSPAGRSKRGSIGIPIPNTDCKIVDMETGLRELPLNESGELLIKGPQVMKGYWKNPEETELAIKDGWFYTGDIATMDEEGYFYIVGRKKDIIIAGGYNIYPVEVEEVIYQHPDVSEVCVFGIPDSYRGETVKAVIVLKESVCTTEENIENWCTERLARYKVPRLIEFRSEIPKTHVGKTLRRALVEDEKRKTDIS